MGQKRNSRECNVETHPEPQSQSKPSSGRRASPSRGAAQHSGPPARPRRAFKLAASKPPSAKAFTSKARSPAPSPCLSTARSRAAINLPGNRVTVGRNGQVAANITAREIVVLGKVHGNVTATDRVDIRAEGALNGDVAAARISIEDGAFFKGGIDIRKPDGKPGAAGAGQPAVTEAATPVALKPAAVPQCSICGTALRFNPLASGAQAPALVGACASARKEKLILGSVLKGRGFSRADSSTNRVRL